MSLAEEKDNHKNSVRLYWDDVWLGDYQLRSVVAHIMYSATGELCIETFECDIHSFLPRENKSVVRLSAANVRLGIRDNTVGNHPQERIRIVEIGHLRIQPLGAVPGARESRPLHVTDCRLDIISHHYADTVISEVLISPDTLQQQQHGAGCGVAHLQVLLENVLQVPVSRRNRDYESHLNAVKRQLTFIVDNPGESQAREYKIARQMTVNLIKEVRLLEQQGQIALAASLLRRIPLAALRLLMPSSEVRKSDERQLVDLLLMLHRALPEKAIALLMTQVNISTLNWHTVMNSPLIKVLSKHYRSPQGGDVAEQKQRAQDIGYLLLALSNQLMIDAYAHTQHASTQVNCKTESNGGLTELFSMLQMVYPQVNTQHSDVKDAGQMVRYLKHHEKPDATFAAIPHYEQLYRLTELPEVLAALAALYRAAGCHTQRLEALVLNVPEDADLALLARCQHALSKTDLENPFGLLIQLSDTMRSTMIADYFGTIKGQLPLKMRVLEAFSRHYSKKEQRRLLQLLPDDVLIRMVELHLFNTEQACIDRLLARSAKVTVAQRVLIAMALPIERLNEQLGALRRQQPINSQAKALLAERIRGTEKRLECMLDMASEFDPEIVAKLCDQDETGLNTSIETRTRNGDVRAARQLTQRVMTELLAKGYRIAADSRATGAFKQYLAGLKQLYIRYRFWSYALFSRLLHRRSTVLDQRLSKAFYSLHELPERDAGLFQSLQLAAKYCDQGMMLLNVIERVRLEAMMAKKV
ncbi:hypothetical protein ElyMa_006819000 [Elysia marginata]|uniref:Uncharacterized protein n=1 Tax=Elysia marginata TaxID=1093978 RepID=A0AAV4J8J9_9GAST|nr:hypothetical protein ElyMa_006819000 [Elysia marginata]